MKLFRNPAFLAAVAMTVIVALYFAFVADFAFAFLGAPETAAKLLGGALLVLPAVGVWWLFHEWRLGIDTQRMATQLEREGRLPIGGGETTPSGRLTDEAAEAAFEVARLGAEQNPDDWRAWFHVAHAYDDNRDRSMARRSMRHAAELFRAERKRDRG
ncbi:hypothetical protein [Demequina sp. NBRC 110053]|uniref:hypothetical protein n=1 Tax=Demequina sp. NBRC 110053 TaxID=1570342 RepID=UPI000A016F41|nr:hypothetical protein [Demequina sp. NBRC 110053]